MSKNNLERQIERTQAKIDAIQDELGSNLESQAKLRTLQQLKTKKYHTELKNKKKELAAPEKKQKR